MTDWRLSLTDIQASIDRIFRYVEGLDFAGFSQDEKTIDAVVRNLEIIGEAARNVPEDFRDSHPEIAWRGMTSMRNRLIHGYFAVDITTVWETITEDLPPLQSAVQKILESDERSGAN